MRHGLLQLGRIHSERAEGLGPDRRRRGDSSSTMAISKPLIGNGNRRRIGGVAPEGVVVRPGKARRLVSLR